MYAQLGRQAALSFSLRRKRADLLGFWRRCITIRAMKKECDICGGSGQVGHFGGVSRFIITWDECPECLGTGICGAGPESASVDEPSPPTPDKTEKNLSD